MSKKSKKSYGIANKDYASFLVKTELVENALTGEIESAEIDFSATEKADAKGKDGPAEGKEGNLKSIKDLKELKSKVRVKKSDNWQMPDLKDIKKYKKRTPTFGGKALRYKKGQKDGKGGRIMPESEARIFRTLAKKDKISIDKAINKYQNKKIKEIDSSYKGQHEFDTEIKDVKNKMSVKVIDSSGKVFNFYGTGAEITKNPNYIKLQTRNLNRIYKAITKDF
tara:strand:+ start:1864 stop:2535 length:672 start_codon:yes stop_codon:yes gene_type:complete